MQYYDDTMYSEGAAEIKFAKNAFLNPVGRASRDISVALAKVFLKKGASVLDATAATGIRGIRYYKESGARDVTMLEINSKVYRDTIGNARHNRVRARVLNESFQEFANTEKARFDMIDLDPFGSAAPYIFDAMKIAGDSSLLAVTATDTAVLCGAHREACLRVYDSVPMHNEFCHEAGMRILIGYIARIAAQFNYGIVVLLSPYYAHYMRTYIVLRHGSKNVSSTLRNLGYVYYCSKCGFRKYSKGEVPEPGRCDKCGSKMTQAGRMWMGGLHDKNVVGEVRDALKGEGFSEEARTLIGRIYDELDLPFYYSVPDLTKRLKISSVGLAEIIECLSGRYRVSRTHFDYLSLKTDAPYDAVLDCMKKKRGRKK